MIYTLDQFLAIIDWINNNNKFEKWAERKDERNFVEGDTKLRNYTKKFKLRDYEPIYENFAPC
jgi:hypothetical protein